MDQDVLGRNYEIKSDGSKVSVRGRLRKSLRQWKQINAPQFVLETIEFGYKLPLLTTPPPRIFRNNKSALDERLFVEDAIHSLLVLNCIVELAESPGIINPLSVSKQKSGKKRLILDLRHINRHLYKSKFKCEDLSVAKEVLRPGDFMFSFDLKSGYHHIDIFPEHRKFLAFSWSFADGSVRYFMFSVLPFGLSSAPYIFTKLLKPLVKKWRGEGKSIILFLDDGLGAAQPFNLAKICSLQIHADLLKFGLLPNEEKCVWEPCQSIVWLGTVINTANSSIAATDKRIESLASDLDDLLRDSHVAVHVKRVATVAGKIISLSNCIGNVTRLMSRNLYSLINSASTWFDFVKLSKEVVIELAFWRENLCKCNGIPIWPVEVRPTRIVYSDASSVGCGSVIAIEGKVFQQNWSELESSRSSTFRELKAVSLSLDAFIEELKSRTVSWFTDNQNVVSIVNKGSKVPELNSISLEIFQKCMLNGITIDVNWIPRDFNNVADEISKIIDYDDYTINDDIFAFLDESWGPHTIDRFACHYNKKLALFNSKFFQPGTSGVNAFSQDWAFANNWLCPPTYLTVRVVNHLKICRAAGTLIVPLWRSAHFWTIICDDGVHFSNFVHDWYVLPHIPNLFIRGKAKNCIFGNGQLKFIMLALRIDFSVPPRSAVRGFCTEFNQLCTVCTT